MRLIVFEEGYYSKILYTILISVHLKIVKYTLEKIVYVIV